MGDVVVIGAGPGGLGFAHKWSALRGGHGVTVLEAGPELSERLCWIDVGQGCRRVTSCDVLRGVGGASALAGGKISDFPAGSGLGYQMGNHAIVEVQLSDALLELSRRVELSPVDHFPQTVRDYSSRMGAQGIDFKYYPAYKYRQQALTAAWQEVADECRARGVDIRSRTVAIDAHPSNGSWAISTTGAITETLHARHLVIATGRSATPLTNSLGRLGLSAANPAQIGVRLEFPAGSWSTMDECHNDLKLKWDGARTYCASKEGRIAPYWLDGVLLAEGSCDAAVKTAWSNIAVVVDATVEERADTINRARKHSGGKLLRQSLGSYIGVSSESEDIVQRERWWKPGQVSHLYGPELHARIHKAVDHLSARVMPPPAREGAFVYGPEVNQVAVRTPINGMTEDGARIWSVGEVTGLYRGILQSFAAGRWLAQQDLDAPVGLQ